MRRALVQICTLAGVGFVLAAANSPGARAQATSPTPTATPANAAPAAWADTLKFSGHVEAGITGNPDGPSNNINFGHLFTDRANTPVMNQLLLTAERPIDPKAPGYDFGFRLQGMYGTDARYTHFFNEFDRVTHSPYQWDIVEANVQAHLPVLTAGGIDVKLGQYVTLEGAEVIDAAGNFFYSHSYIFNFGIPFKHTGVMTVTHINPLLDLYVGADTGVNASLFEQGDNNDAFAFHGGVGLNLLDGAVTVLATTHIGPENPEGTPGVRVNSALRYLNDITVTWKISDALTSITDINYIHDDGLHASGGGVAQYLTYTLNDWLSVGGRAEVWRDDNGVFVAAFPGSLDFVNAERGKPATVIGGGKTTYGALTVGLNIKPPVPKVFDGAVVRPEIRFDDALNGTKPFNAGTKSSQVTLAVDVIVPF